MTKDEVVDVGSVRKLNEATRSEHEPVEKPGSLGDGNDPLALAIEGAVGRAATPLLQAVEDRLAFDRFLKAEIDKLHRELQDYRVDLVSKAVQPPLQSLIRLHDEMGKVLEVLMDNDRADAAASSEPITSDLANPEAEAIEKPEPLRDGNDPVALAIEGAVGRAAAPLLRAIEDRLALDRFRETEIDKLHGELQAYKADLVNKAIQPVLKSLIRLHDDVGKVLEALEKEEPAQLTPERALRLLDGFREDVELALHHNGVTAFRTEEDTFDPRRQRVLRSVPTDNPDTVGRLAARLRPGFEQGEAILEKERIAVYVIAPGSAA